MQCITKIRKENKETSIQTDF